MLLHKLKGGPNIGRGSPAAVPRHKLALPVVLRPALLPLRPRFAPKGAAQHDAPVGESVDLQQKGGRWLAVCKKPPYCLQTKPEDGGGGGGEHPKDGATTEQQPDEMEMQPLERSGPANPAFPYPLSMDQPQRVLSSIPWPLFYPAMVAAVGTTGAAGFGVGRTLPGL